MPKKKTVKKTRRAQMGKPAVMRNQFFGMVLVAIGIGALIVVVRYFVISMQVPTEVYEIRTSDLIPGAN